MNEKTTHQRKIAYLKSVSQETLLSEYQLQALCRENSVQVNQGAVGDFISATDRRVLLQIIGPVKRPSRYKPLRAVKDPRQKALDLTNRIARLRQGLHNRDRDDALATISRCTKLLDTLEKQRNLTSQDLESFKVLRKQLKSLHTVALTLPTQNLVPNSKRPNMRGGLPSLGKNKR